MHRRLRSRTWRRVASLALLPLALATTLVACGDDEAPPSEETRRATRAVAPKLPPYRETALPRAGTISGVLEADPARLVALRAEAAEEAGCGTRSRRARRGDDDDVVVWVEGIREGKRLPMERRYELLIDECRWSPLVQGAIAGGALHVKSLDAVEHVTRLVRADGGDVVAEVRQADRGALMPLDRVLDRPGVLEARSAATGRAEAWVAVFDHPYFATSRVNGAFRIDELPPGAHTVVAWHPKLGLVKQQVDVESGETSRVRLKF